MQNDLTTSLASKIVCFCSLLRCDSVGVNSILWPYLEIVPSFPFLESHLYILISNAFGLLEAPYQSRLHTLTNHIYSCTIEWFLKYCQSLS